MLTNQKLKAEQQKNTFSTIVGNKIDKIALSFSLSNFVVILDVPEKTYEHTTILPFMI